MLDFQGFLSGGGCEIRTHAPVKANGFQDWIVSLPGVHGSSLCIPNFTAKKDKKVLKWTVFGKNARKLCEKGKNPKKIQIKNQGKTTTKMVGSNGIVAWAKMHIKQRNIYLTVCRLPN